MISDDLESVKGFHPHDLLSGFDVEAVFHGEDHHRVVAHVHGVHFVAFHVGHHRGALFDHGDVDAVRHGADVADLLLREDGFEFEASLGGAVLSGLGLGDAEDLVGLFVDHAKAADLQGANLNAVGSGHALPSVRGLMTISQRTRG